MQADDTAFSWLVEYLTREGYVVVKVPLDWNYKTISNNAKEFVAYFNKNKDDTNYVLGFSYGAVITFITANQVLPDKIFLCSLSPTFVEDQHWEKKWIKYIGKRRYEDSLTRSSVRIARDIRVPSVVFCGEKEAIKYPALMKRCREVSKIAPQSKLVVVKDAPHQIDFPEYVSAIKRELSALQ